MKIIVFYRKQVFDCGNNWFLPQHSDAYCLNRYFFGIDCENAVHSNDIRWLIDRQFIYKTTNNYLDIPLFTTNTRMSFLSSFVLLMLWIIDAWYLFSENLPQVNAFKWALYVIQIMLPFGLRVSLTESQSLHSNCFCGCVLLRRL